MENRFGDSARYVSQSGFEIEPGVVLNGEFEILEYVGKGGTARVWRARHLLGRFDVAVKLLNATRRDFDLGREEFHRLSLLHHPNVVRTFGMSMVDGHDQAFITMEFIDGPTVDELTGSDSDLDSGDVVSWLVQMVDVLKYLHSMRVFHKDIKPNNIVIDSSRIEPRAVLIDFNISHLGPEFGTPAYKCPTVGAASGWTWFADVWALALTFYEVLTKREVFAEKTAFDVALADPCPTSFPAGTFSALKMIIRGEGDDSSAPADYRGLFGLPSRASVNPILPAAVAEEYGITSRNQQFLTEAMLRRDPSTPRSKDVIVRSALHAANRPAGADMMRKLRAVFSQLKAREVVEYFGKGSKKARLTERFLGAIERAGEE